MRIGQKLWIFYTGQFLSVSRFFSSDFTCVLTSQTTPETAVVNGARTVPTNHVICNENFKVISTLCPISEEIVV